jgi:hypothetical protein
MPQRYGDFATWAGSVGTIAAFAVAFVQIHTERQARKKREAGEWLAAKRAHADHVTAWVSGEVLTLSNQSHHLISDVEAEFDDGTVLTADHVTPGHTTMPAPGEHAVRAVPWLRFTDARGDRWVREGGELPHLAT